MKLINIKQTKWRLIR